MRRLIIVSFSALSLSFMRTQNPVLLETCFEKNKPYCLLNLNLTIQRGWNVYSQRQPADVIALPNTIPFNNNPMVRLVGKPCERGSLEKHKDQTLGMEQWQYSNSMGIVQKILLKTRMKTVTTGSITY